MCTTNYIPNEHIGICKLEDIAEMTSTIVMDDDGARSAKGRVVRCKIGTQYVKGIHKYLSATCVQEDV